MQTRDRSYYFRDATRVFQVENHLFRIHDYLLTRESLFFERMFSLPQPSKGLEDGCTATASCCDGSSDDNPILCHDKLDAFRALCWALYARPLEVHQQEDPKYVDITRLLSIAAIAHKYEFTSLEEWSISVIRSHWMADFGTQNESKTGERLIWTLGDIQELVFLSLEIETIDATFKKSIEGQWLARISNPKFGNSTIVQRTLTFADGLSSQRLRALAYYYTLRRFGLLQLCGTGDGGRLLEPESFREHNQSDWLTHLTNDQRRRLMHGLWSLVSLRGTYSLAHIGCADVYCKQGSGVGCAEAWKEYGTRVGTSLDFGKLLEDAIHQLQAGSLPGGLLFNLVMSIITKVHLYLQAGQRKFAPESYCPENAPTLSQKLYQHPKSLGVEMERKIGASASVLLNTISAFTSSLHLGQWGTVFAGSHFTLGSIEMAKLRND
ncbi:hypothetical protein NP233_g8631 [Leucocoprinus birnbaumii]|uniref:BTB domain-containing protein n=1 Tax=Leucocoprinus birnbaumii TaxID=56174 RepID=A0AAD5YTN7_9AGAR|nr:hypothetical protein NP233_g8631 [Leucocoprinus birnbaumii]